MDGFSIKINISGIIVLLKFKGIQAGTFRVHTAGKLNLLGGKS
jgi:hypothetical protein